MNQPQLDPVAVVTALAAAAGVGAAGAPLVGAYAVIAIAAGTGAGWALGRREPVSRAGMALFVLRMIATALLTTWFIAAALQRYVPGVDGASWLLAPVALVIGAVGDDWSEIGRWLLQRFRRRAARAIDADDGGQP